MTRTFCAAMTLGSAAGVVSFARAWASPGGFLGISEDPCQSGALNAIAGDPRVSGRAYIVSANRGVLYAEPLKK